MASLRVDSILRPILQTGRLRPRIAPKSLSWMVFKAGKNSDILLDFFQEEKTLAAANINLIARLKKKIVMQKDKKTSSTFSLHFIIFAGDVS